MFILLSGCAFIGTFLFLTKERKRKIQKQEDFFIYIFRYHTPLSMHSKYITSKIYRLKERRRKRRRRRRKKCFKQTKVDFNPNFCLLCLANTVLNKINIL
jgi:hypothetical protein